MSENIFSELGVILLVIFGLKKSVVTTPETTEDMTMGGRSKTLLTEKLSSHTEYPQSVKPK